MTYLREDTKLLAGHLALLHGLPYPVVAALHQPPLQLDWVAQIAVRLNCLETSIADAHAQALKLAVEDIITALGQKEQEVQSRDLVPCIVVGLELAGRELVEGLQLLYVALEGIGIPGADRCDGTELVDFPGSGEQVGGGRGGRRQGLELQ